MKKRIQKALAIALIAVLAAVNLNLSVYAAGSAAYAVERTKAWDGINQTLGGVPENVRRIEHQGSTFYLAPDVSDDDFLAVLTAGPEAVRLVPPQNSGRLYSHPVYILWNSGGTVLLVHPIIWDYDDILDAAAVPALPPAKLMDTSESSASLTADEAVAYMLTAEYADAVRAEFYRLVNEHRTDSGLRALEVNLALQGYADIRAEEQRTCFGHTRPNGTPAGSGWHNSRNNLNTRYAENALSAGAISPDPLDTALGIFQIWKESAGHNQHMLYNFSPHITMAFGFSPKLGADGFVTSGAIFATGY